MLIWSVESQIWRTEKSYGHQSGWFTYVIYACFELHNYCKMNNKTTSDDRVRVAIGYDRNFQPAAIMGNGYRSDCNEAESKRVRSVPTKYFDP